MDNNQVDYYPGANWAVISGAFTPEALREIADKIDEAYKDVKDDQE